MVRRPPISQLNNTLLPYTTLFRSDLPTLSQSSERILLFERALWARARRGDYSVIPHVLLMVPADPEHWLGIGTYVWSGPMTEMLGSVMDALIDRKSTRLNSSH